MHDGPISPELYHEYSQNLRRGVSITLGNDFSELEAQFLANVSRFAAYKAYQATQKVKEAAGEGDVEEAKFWIRKFNSWQAAEYNTTVARTRTAKQWSEWDSPDDRELMPNIKWLPSRSVQPREEHEAFYWKIWPKDDPFWDNNQPGNLWNCKCDWQQTDEEPTENNPTSTILHKGLDGNPAKTGQLFSDNSSYFVRAEPESWGLIRNEIRNDFRSNSSKTRSIETSIGNITIDNISVQEISKGSKTPQSYFYKHEIMERFKDYIEKLEYICDEDIDLTHNNHKSIFYQRKKLFSKMEKYRLSSGGFDFTVKIGVYKDGTKNLYCITEPNGV